MQPIQVFKYQYDPEYGYDWLGENIRNDLESLIELSTQNAKVTIEIIYNTADPLTNIYVYNILNGTCYDYIGESIRDEIEEKTDIGCQITVTYQ
jgi:hypothetical protein